MSFCTKNLISPLSIAPMIDWTYNHYRYFLRLIVPEALIYTEMQTVGAIHNNPLRALNFHIHEQPLALQLGGSSIEGLVDCAIKAQEAGFKEVNLNLGCPSDRVISGQFGACLMAEPKLVSACIAAMKAAVSIPVTAKTRIGIDNNDSFEFFSDFVHHLIDSGCDKLIVHARKAWLHGLNPKQNRTIPPLHYDYVYKIKKIFPDIPVVINGNINTLDDLKAHEQLTDGVMIGRLACNNPYALGAIHQHFYPEIEIPSRLEIVKKYHDYLHGAFESGASLALLLKPLFNLAHGISGAKLWKDSLLTIQQSKSPDGYNLLIEQMAKMEESS